MRGRILGQRRRRRSRGGGRSRRGGGGGGELGVGRAGTLWCDVIGESFVGGDVEGRERITSRIRSAVTVLVRTHSS